MVFPPGPHTTPRAGPHGAVPYRRATAQHLTEHKHIDALSLGSPGRCTGPGHVVLPRLAIDRIADSLAGPVGLHRWSRDTSGSSLYHKVRSFTRTILVHPTHYGRPLATMTSADSCPITMRIAPHRADANRRIRWFFPPFPGGPQSDFPSLLSRYRRVRWPIHAFQHGPQSGSRSERPARETGLPG